MTYGYKRWLLLCLLPVALSACGGPTRVPTTNAQEKPLFSDADIDKAIRLTTGAIKELIGIERGIVPAGQEIPALPDNQGELTPRAVLPSVGGDVYYLRHDPNRLFGSPYSVFRHQHLDDNLALIYSGDREIQSVAGSYSVFVVSMKETTDPSSDFDIFLFDFYDPNNLKVYLLTDDTVDNTNISVNLYDNGIVYEQPVAGKATLVLRRGHCCNFDTYYLIYSDAQRQPSISQDGQYITFIRDLGNGTHEVVKYTIATNTYLSVASSSAVLDYPSISNDGQKVMWLEHGSRDSVKLKNLTTGTTQTVLSDTFIAHPFLTANGLYMTYQTTRKIVTRDLSTGQNAYVATTPFATVSFYNPMWQQEALPKPILLEASQNLRPHEPLRFYFNTFMISDSVNHALTLLVNGQIRTSAVRPGIASYPVEIIPVPPLEFGDVVSWSFSSGARSYDGQRLDPVAGSSWVNRPPDGALTVNISGSPTGLARVNVTDPHGSIRNVGSTMTLTGLISGMYSISALGFRTNVGRLTCRIYTPDFFSYATTVEYYLPPPTIDVIYRSEPCGF